MIYLTNQTKKLTESNKTSNGIFIIFPGAAMFIRVSIPSFRQVGPGGPDDVPQSPTVTSPQSGASPWKSYFVYQVSGHWCQILGKAPIV